MTGDRRIGVGIVGANPERGWAARGHLPALRALPGYRLAAVATTRPESARAAAEVFGAAHAFTDPRRLSEHPEVDLVVVTVAVAAHAELVGAALAAGKHVYCEWPLGVSTVQASGMAEAAGRAGVLAVAGLQARFAPALRRARELVDAGALGRVTSVTVHATRGKGAEEAVPGWTAYTYDRDGGAGLLEVYGGHTLDALEFLAGPVVELSAALSVQRPRHTVAETGRALDVTAPDHLLLSARLASGAMASVHVHDGKVGAPGARIELAGTAGDLVVETVEADGPLGGQLQISPLRLRRAAPGTGWREVPLPASAPGGVPVEARNVAALYAQLAADLIGARPDPAPYAVPDAEPDTMTGTPTFTEGLRVHRLLDAVRRAADTGHRQRVDQAPALTR
jgi:predicted dehydrogenase